MFAFPPEMEKAAVAICRCSLFELSSQFYRFGGARCAVYFFWNEGVRRFWGLTRDFSVAFGELFCKWLMGLKLRSSFLGPGGTGTLMPSMMMRPS
jgi:hypothetical protein